MFIKKFFETCRAFYDLRAIFLLVAAFIIGMFTDPAATFGLAGYLAFVIGMAGAALMLSKVMMPYLRTSQHIRSALQDHNIASALVVLAKVILMLGLLIALMAWGK